MQPRERGPASWRALVLGLFRREGLMHFEVLVEDRSGAIALEALLKKILTPEATGHTYTIHSYKGLGSIPRNLRHGSDPRKRILLSRLPGILRGYGKSLSTYNAVVVVVVDLDQRDCRAFKRELVALLDECVPRPDTLFRFAIEEIEAWYLGDPDAVKEAYPDARLNAIEGCMPDAVENTWERLADALYPGGSSALKREGYPRIGEMKCEWARNIAPHVDLERNRSHSLKVFMNGVLRKAGIVQ
ncbi:MAG: DUF4276 family protein [Candidatus Eremiobacteraeota bacterium]|nr:DUF4276 family protein [Candidatus Eremiobacteraeota bacterium]